MKILFLGQMGFGQTSLMHMRAFERLGHAVRGVHTIEPWTRASWLKRQVQRRLHCGSVVMKSIVPSWILHASFGRTWLGPRIRSSCASKFEKLRKLDARSIHFTPDSYISVEIPRIESGHLISGGLGWPKAIEVLAPRRSGYTRHAHDVGE
jgi:hypothetical protein